MHSREACCKGGSEEGAHNLHVSHAINFAVLPVHIGGWAEPGKARLNHLHSSHSVSLQSVIMFHSIVTSVPLGIHHNRAHERGGLEALGREGGERK